MERRRGKRRWTIAALGGSDYGGPTVRVRTFSFAGGNDVRHPQRSERDR